ncbi:threonylcarbamoyl-AMP synthase [Candidatus Woesearchaeota archaeon]|nr:threonylcarbamoyl-AMP synthase [Candidatus Woesearchaeota archaeon]
MRVISKEEFLIEVDDIVEQVDEGSVFVHPTDTIYGIGCDATNKKAVSKIREAKDRPDQPFSVMVPSKDWIRENCEMNEKIEEWIQKLPGPYTLIIKLKNKDAVAKNVNPGKDTLGVRIPKHWFTVVARKLKKPIVTTSTNKVGEDYMTSLENLDHSIKAKMDFCVYEGEKEGRPSSIVHLEKEETKVMER